MQLVREYIEGCARGKGIAVLAFGSTFQGNERIAFGLRETLLNPHQVVYKAVLQHPVCGWDETPVGRKLEIAKAARDVGIHGVCGDDHGCSGAGAGRSGLRDCDCLVTQAKFGLTVVGSSAGVRDNDTFWNPRGY